MYFKEKLLYRISRYINLCFRNGLNRFLMIEIISISYFIITRQFNIILLIISSIIALVFSLSFKRVSNNFNLNKITGTLNMNIRNLDEYHKYSYIEDKDKIAEKLAKEFIEGIVSASNNKKKLKMNTHSWMIREVINSKEVQDRFDIKIIVDPLKEKRIITEILILFSKKEFEENIEYTYKIASKKRDSCKVVLKKLTIDELIERQGVK